ncbi:SAM-dependent methyltransferase [Streptomyces sp. NPDC085866]|uniref:SAM-dependent methyltransferase n=1 Tax=Streptomyces sp. NPDC085866 TaxID=3365736 RepID=UPI0037CDC992
MSTDQQWDIVSGVGMTALMVAAARAVESDSPGALVRDPYAARFVETARPAFALPTTAAGARGSGAAQAAMWEVLRINLAVRTHAFDSFLREAVGRGAAQVVLLASGLDTRAFRLPWPPGLVCFELDQPAVLDFKLRVLEAEGAEPTCDHRPVGVDLRDDWVAALGASGFDPARPTAWLAEGLLSYLPPEDERRLLHDVHRLSAPGSALAVESIQDMAGVLTDAGMTEGMRAIGIDLPRLVHTDDRPAPDAQLDELGWNTDRSTASRAAAEHGYAVADDSFMGRILHVSARRS